MPELPEVETVRLGLAPVLEGQLIVRVDQRRANMRFPFPENLVARMTGRRIRTLGRRAKYLLLHLDDGQVLIAHLGMSGSMRIGAGWPDPPEKHDHLIWQVQSGASVRFNDPRRFGFVLATSDNALPTHAMLAGLGPEPLGPEFTVAGLAASFHGRRAPVKTALLDQRIVAGLGNIYVCEALWRAGLSPLRSCGSLSVADLERLVPAIRSVLGEAVAAGGSSLRDHVQADGELGYFQHSHAVYGRAGQECRRCGAPATILRLEQGGRGSFYCPSCQH
jgi:formamidopyrimidine-DNA glycosylase